MTCKTSYATSGSQASPSTVGREIMYSVAHAVHHYALIGFMAAVMGLALPPGFGIAPSTLKHQRGIRKGRGLIPIPLMTEALPLRRQVWLSGCRSAKAAGFFFATFILEDVAAIGAGLLLASAAKFLGWQRSVRCFLGIWLGDVGLYAIARDWWAAVVRAFPLQ
ncbi:MAG: hypothetical protein QM813_05455 [Verrucomicrobiota bacterium]